MVEYSHANIEKYIEGIYDGSITEYDLPESLYLAIGNYFQKGLYKGFGMNLKEAAGKDLELLAELRENVWLFSAAKEFQMTKGIGELMVNENNELKSFKEFYTDAKQTYDLYNETYALTEYNTAVGQAQNAVKWNEIEKQKKILPMLRYSAVVDANTSDICLPLDGIVAPVGDPIWDTIAPENHFNCRCLLIQEEETVEATPDDEKEEKVKEVEGNMSDLFKMNPGKDGYVFKDDHPYFQVERKDKEFAKENFGLPMPEAVKGIERGFVPAENIKEAEAFAIDKLNISYDNQQLNVNAMNTINERLQKLKSEYPTDRLKRINAKGMTAYADTTGVVMNFDKSYWNNFEKLQNSLDKGIIEKWSAKIPIEGIIDHEFAHVLTSSEVLLDTPIAKEFEAVRAKYIDKMDLLIKKGIDHTLDVDFISIYSNKSLDEFIAEGFALSKNNPNAGKYAKMITKIIDKYFKK